jgi:hypothetical protein
MSNMAMGKCQDQQKKSHALFKQNVNISKEDMEDYNWAMFTHAMDFFKEWVSLKNSIPNFFHKLIKRFVNRGFGNMWQLAINKIHET